MHDGFPQFDSEDEMRDWFDNADLSQYGLEQAMEVVVASRVALSIGEPFEDSSGTVGATGTLRELHLVRD
jgi:hypothetical protein